jgi:crossover junction endodeoxyribonuclease RuvC
MPAHVPTGKLRVLGIDPGTRHLGWGVLEQEGTRITHIAHGVIDTDTDRELAHRLIEIDDALAVVIEEHRPTTSAVEALFFAKDPQAAAKLGHARGVVLLRLARAGLPIHELAPSRVKRAQREISAARSALRGLAEVSRPNTSCMLRRQT